MRTGIIILSVFLFIAKVAFSKDIYVSKRQGAENGDGSAGNPCLTISQGVSLATDGDEILVLDGIFRETVYITKSNIRIIAGSDSVFITGTDLVNSFEDTGNGLYKAYFPNEVTQLFVDGIPQVRAKYPNQSVDNNLFNFTTIKASFYGNTLTSNEITQPDGFFDGATVWMLINHRWLAGTAKVTRHTGNTLELSNISLNYEGTGIAFISNCKNCLDNDGEWYWENDTLYYKNGSIDILESKVEAKTRETLIYLENVEHVRISGINGYAGNVLFDNTRYCKLSNGNFKYLTDYDYIKGGAPSYGRTERTNITSYGLGIAMFGTQDTVSRCEVAWSAGDCITQYGTQNVVYRSTIHDGNYRATDCSAICLGGIKNEIIRCEVYNAGRDLIFAGPGKQFKVLYNKLYRAGLIAWDLGVIYTWGADGENAEIAYNHISEGYSGNPDPTWGAVGVYLDNGSRNYLVHHNVIHDIKGMGIQYNYPAYNLRSYNNTIYNTVRDMSFVGEDQPGFTVGECKMYNNYTDKRLLNNNWVESKNNLITSTDYLQNRDSGNYLPKPNSILINRGMIIDEMINVPFSGNDPDVGAYEYGRTPWEVGPDSKEIELTPKETLKDSEGQIMRGTPMFLAKNLDEQVRFATDINNWLTIKNNGFNTVRVCWVDPWYKDRNEDHWSVSEVIPYIDSCVHIAIKTGMNIIINYHNPGAQQNYDTQFSFEQEKEFWDSIAPRYINNAHVYYEIVDEPSSNMSDYLMPAFKQNLLNLYKTVSTIAPDRQILMFSFGTIDGDIVEVVEHYRDSIDWEKTSVAYHMYNKNSSYAIRTLRYDYRLICTEWDYFHNRRGYGHIQEVDGFKQNSQTLENLGSSWIDWRSWNDTTLNELLDTLIFDAQLKNYWWGKPVSGVKVTGVTISKDSIIMNWGTSEQLIAMVFPALAENQKIIWHSSDTNIVSVNSEGLITSKVSMHDEAIISAISDEGGYIATCKVTVIQPENKKAYPDGIPHEVPGTINSTYYDLGGEGVSYHDMSPGNLGDGIRQDEGVDTEYRLSEGSVGAIQSGEWLEYTINVIEDGEYTFEILFATTGRYGKFHIEMDGSKLTDIQYVKPSGDFNIFKPTTIKNVSLTKGLHIMRVVFDFANYNMGTISIYDTTSVGDVDETVGRTIIYPNPVREKLFIASEIHFDKYSIHSLLGQTIMQGVLLNNQTIDTSKLPDGYYFIKLMKKNHYEWKMLVKKK